MLLESLSVVCTVTPVNYPSSQQAAYGAVCVCGGVRGRLETTLTLKGQISCGSRERGGKVACRLGGGRGYALLKYWMQDVDQYEKKLNRCFKAKSEHFV